MKKTKNYIVATFFLFFVYSMQGQIVSDINIRIIYQLTYTPDSTNSEFINDEIFFLNISKDKSIFCSKTEYLKDSILNTSNPLGMLSIARPKYIEFKERIIKSKYSNILDMYYDYTNYKFSINDSVKLNWKIQSDTVNYMNYECGIAYTNFRGRTYKAYFTKQIPVSDGPYKFSGLPGLILKLEDTKKHYVFEVINLLKFEKPFDYYLFKPDLYKPASKKELKDFEKKIKAKPSILIDNPSIVQIPQSGLDVYDKKHIERNKNRNNPIELE
jgi:GLPGLI family protein